MKKTLLVFALLTIAFFPGFTQMSILLVDDSDDAFNHVEDFSAALDSLGWAHNTYDAAGTRTTPSINDLAIYDLVIWHAGSDSDSLSFWSRTDTANIPLATYLGAGGKLWVIGTDLLYDRHGGAPKSFLVGDFELDFMGLESYDLQSYVDDGSVGMPIANPSPLSPISNLPSLDWIFSTLWYVDGVTPFSGLGVPVYEMGDSGYMFAGHTCAVWADNNNSQVLSFFFNISQASTFNLMKDATEQVLNFFQSQVVATDPAAASFLHASLSPNPGTDRAALTMESPLAGNGQIRVFSAVGAEVLAQEISVNAGANSFALEAQDWEANIYFVRLEVEGFTQTLKWVKQ